MPASFQKDILMKQHCLLQIEGILREYLECNNLTQNSQEFYKKKKKFISMVTLFGSVLLVKSFVERITQVKQSITA